MKLTVKPLHFKYLILGAGGLGLVLRVLLYATGIDEKGLLVTGHWAHWGVWLLTAATAAVLFLLSRPIQGPERYEDAYPVSFSAAAGCFLAAAAFLGSSLSGFSAAATRLDMIVHLMGIAAAASLAYVGYCRLTRNQPLFLFHAVVCVYLALRMVFQYRFWSSDPQLQDYCFYLGAYVGLMLTSYHLAAFDAGMGSHRMLWMIGLATVYLCCLSLSGSRENLFLLCCGIWVFTNLTNLTVKPRRQRPALDLSGEAPGEEA